MECKLDRALGVSLKSLFPKAQFCGSPDILVRSCYQDPESCTPGSVFVCIDEDGFNDVESIEHAVENGANAILAERLLPCAVPVCVVDDVREAHGQLLHTLADYDAKRMHTIGVTGSHGKTATTELVHAVLNQCGQPSGVVNSLRVATHEKQRPAMTQATASDIAELMSDLWIGNARHAVIEASSAMLASRELAGTRLDAAIITNIRRDHVDLHGSLRSYRAMKRRIIRHLKPEGFAVINADDPTSAALIDTIPNPTITYGIHQPAQVTAHLVERYPSEQTFMVRAGRETRPVRTRIIGHQHIYRCLATIAYGLVAGYSLDDLVAGVESIEELPGELQRIECGQPFSAFVHNASNPDRLATALKTLQTVANGRVVVIAGASYRSEAEERAVIGRTAERYADKIFFTSDTHASSVEDATRILHDLLDGCEHPSRVKLNPNRIHALQWALSDIEEGDCILVASHGGGFADDAFLLREFLYEQARTKPQAVLPRLRVVSPN